jgi:hypothetical protein
MAVKGPCVFTSYLVSQAAMRNSFSGKVLFLTERPAEPSDSTAESLERGVVRSLLRSIQKSSDRLVVTQREAV